LTLRRIYLDNAATSWPKPEQVYQAVDHYLRQNGAPAGRSAYAESLEVDSLIERSRRLVSEFIGALDPKEIIFTSGGTESLNVAIHGLLRPGDHVVTTAAEHNSVLRPLRFLEDAGTVRVTRLRCDTEGFVELDQLRQALREETRLVAVTHASNVTGAIQPVEKIIEMAHRASALVLVDAAQTAGHVPINVSTMNIDLLAAPGHKGLLGPLGTGVLYIRPGLQPQITSRKQGGTGTSSDQDRQPEQLPMKFESGSPNVPGIIGLAAGIEFLLARGIDSIEQHSRQFSKLLNQRLAEVPGVRLFGPTDVAKRAGLASLSIEGYDPQEVAATLDAAKRIQVRAGYHCAAAMHQSLGTAQCGGTVRLSWGPFNTVEDITIAADVIAELAQAVTH
jgi:cysteine desulfurase family protein